MRLLVKHLSIMEIALRIRRNNLVLHSKLVHDTYSVRRLKSYERVS